MRVPLRSTAGPFLAAAVTVGCGATAGVVRGGPDDAGERALQELLTHGDCGVVDHTTPMVPAQRWCWHRPSGRAVRALARSGEEIWVGIGTTVLRWDGASWSRELESRSTLTPVVALARTEDGAWWAQAGPAGSAEILRREEAGAWRTVARGHELLRPFAPDAVLATRGTDHAIVRQTGPELLALVGARQLLGITGRDGTHAGLVMSLDGILWVYPSGRRRAIRGAPRASYWVCGEEACGWWQRDDAGLVAAGFAGPNGWEETLPPGSWELRRVGRDLLATATRGTTTLWLHERIAHAIPPPEPGWTAREVIWSADAVVSTTPSGSLYELTDEGWRALATAAPLTVTPRAGIELAAGLLVETTNGTSVARSSPARPARWIDATIDGGRVLSLSSDGDVYFSLDGDWRKVNAGTHGMRAPARVRADGDDLLLFSEEGVRRCPGCLREPEASFSVAARTVAIGPDAILDPSEWSSARTAHVAFVATPLQGFAVHVAPSPDAHVVRLVTPDNRVAFDLGTLPCAASPCRPVEQIHVLAASWDGVSIEVLEVGDPTPRRLDSVAPEAARAHVVSGRPE